MVIFRWFRGLVEAIHALTVVLTELAGLQRELGPAIGRVEALERSRHQFEAECEGMMLKADGKLKAASSAEQRERQLKKANERLADPFDLGEVEAAEHGTHVLTEDARPGEPQGMSPVRLAMAPDDGKAHAVRTKWGMT